MLTIRAVNNNEDYFGRFIIELETHFHHLLLEHLKTDRMRASEACSRIFLPIFSLFQTCIQNKRSERATNTSIQRQRQRKDDDKEGVEMKLKNCNNKVVPGMHLPDPFHYYTLVSVSEHQQYITRCQW